MPRNGSGGFNLVTNTWSPATNGVSATAADWTALINDLAAAVQQSISADGQTPVTGSLNMGGNRLTGLSAGNATGHSLRFEQLFSQGLQQDIAAAATVDIGAGLSVLVNVTGAGAITSFGTNYNGPRYLRFAGVCTLTNSATLVLPGGGNITTAAGDSAIVVPLGNPATGWRVAGYERAAGLAALAGPLATSGITGAAASGANTDITSLLPQAIVGKIQPITASVAANALTLTLNPTSLDFRSATLSSGTVNTRQVSAAISLTISSGSTLGTINNTQSRIAVLAIDNAGTVELAAANIAGGNDLSETGLITTVAEGGAGAADTANVIYSTTARASVPYRVVGYVESTQATAGTWATAPSTIQGQGGQALAAMSSLGYGQTWQVVTGSRALNTVYYNTTGRPFAVSGYATNGGVGVIEFQVNGSALYRFTGPTASVEMPWFGIVPAGSSYQLNIGGSATLTRWAELR